MRLIGLLWYGIFIGAWSLQAKSDGKTDDDLCDTNELTLPDNAISWDCTDSKTIKNKVYRGGRCELQCKEFYKRVVGKSF